MKKPFATMVLVVLSAASVSGCQSIFSRHSKLDGEMAPVTESAGYGAIQLTLGKKALDNHRYADAITAFRVARLDPGLAPEALNGLAIAYTGMGRTDLSERYFNEAITLAPTDERFRSNLARLYRTRLVPQDGPAGDAALALVAKEESILAPPKNSVEVASFQKSGQISVAKPTTRLIRVSSAEVRIGAAPVPSVNAGRADRQAAVTVQRTSPIARNYSVRIGMASNRSAAAANYPIRVELPSSR